MVPESGGEVVREGLSFVHSKVAICRLLWGLCMELPKRASVASSVGTPPINCRMEGKERWDADPSGPDPVSTANNMHTASAGAREAQRGARAARVSWPPASERSAAVISPAKIRRLRRLDGGRGIQERKVVSHGFQSFMILSFQAGAQFLHPVTVTARHGMGRKAQ